MDYQEFLDKELKGIDRIESEVPLKTIYQVMGDEYPGFKGGKVKTILTDGRQFLFTPDETNDELSLIYAVELVLSREIPRDKINENFGDTTDYTSKIEKIIKEYWKSLEDKKLFDAIADIETQVKTTDDEFQKPLAYYVEIATMRKGLNDRADEIGEYVADKIPSIEYAGYRDTKILDSDFGSDVTLKFTQSQEMPDFGENIFDSEKVEETDNPKRYGVYKPGDLVQLQDPYSGKYYGKYKVVKEMDPEESKEKYGSAVIGYELETIEPKTFAGETIASNNYRMRFIDPINEDEDLDSLDDVYPIYKHIEDNWDKYYNGIREWMFNYFGDENEHWDSGDVKIEFDELDYNELINLAKSLGIKLSDLNESSEDVSVKEIKDDPQMEVYEMLVNGKNSGMSKEDNIKATIEEKPDMAEYINLKADEIYAESEEIDSDLDDEDDSQDEDNSEEINYLQDRIYDYERYGRGSEEQYHKDLERLHQLQGLDEAESVYGTKAELFDKFPELKGNENYVSYSDDDYMAVDLNDNGDIEGIRLATKVDENINDKVNAILSDKTTSEIISIIGAIQDLQSTIKHTIEDEMISINARIEELNNQVKYSVEELETENVYSNTNSVIKDLEYLIKESDWAKEDAEEVNESDDVEDEDTDAEIEYVCHSDEDANNDNEYFDDEDKAIEYAKNHDEIVAVLKVDHNDESEEIIWTRDDLDESEELVEEVMQPGDKYVNGVGAVIVITDPTNDGRPQYNIAQSQKDYDAGKFVCMGTDSYESLDKILKDNSYTKVN